MLIVLSTGEAALDSHTLPSTASVCFHPHCGSLIKLSNNNRTAERQRPTEEFKNAVTLTNIPLRNDELFEVSKQIKLCNDIISEMKAAFLPDLYIQVE